MRYILTILAIIFGCLILISCPSNGDSKTTKLTVNITIKTGLNANVKVTGPSGFEETLTENQTLDKLKAGEYQIIANDVTDAPAIYTATVDKNTVTLSEGQEATVNVTYTIVTGELSVTISTPAGTPQVTINGPENFTQSLNSTEILQQLTPGAYTIAAEDIIANPSNSIIDTAYDASIDNTSVVVTSGETANANITYNQRGGSGRLWVAVGEEAEDNHLLNSFEANLLSESGNPQATSSIEGDNTTLSQPADIAFDAKGNLWIANFNTGSILKFTPSQQTSTSNSEPEVVLSGSILERVFTLAFDSEGNLWAGTFRDDIIKFTPSQITDSGSPDPVVTINRNFNFGLPRKLAFDSNGNLWMSLVNDPSIVMHSKAQLATSAENVVPTVILAGFGAEAGIAFDAEGNLWVGSSTENFQGRISKLNKSQLNNSSDSIVPNVIIEGLISSPNSLAFDVESNLWALVAGDNRLLKYTPAQLTSSGSPTPEVSIELEGDFNQNAIAFNPSPANLPIE